MMRGYEVNEIRYEVRKSKNETAEGIRTSGYLGVRVLRCPDIQAFVPRVLTKRLSVTLRPDIMLCALTLCSAS